MVAGTIWYNTKTMTYDCFPFFNELDLLEIRLNVLKDVVDKFVLVEAGETHTGKPKPFYFEENRGRFAAFADRIIYLKIEKFPAGHDAWWNENYQRNEIMKCLVGCKDDDDILISDLDEIPNPEKVRGLVGKPGVVAFRQDYYSFYLNYRSVRDFRWCGTRMLSYRDFLHCFDGVDVYDNEILVQEVNEGTTASKIRCRRLPRSRGGEHIISDGGWHFTCLGGAEAVLAKMRAVVPHHDFDPDDRTLTVESIAKKIAEGRGPALKMNCFAVPIDGSFPAYVRENQERYAHLIFKVTPEYMKRVRWARFGRALQGRLIGFAEWLCPPALHNWLHLVKMRFVLTEGKGSGA